MFKFGFSFSNNTVTVLGCSVGQTVKLFLNPTLSSHCSTYSHTINVS